MPECTHITVAKATGIDNINTCIAMCLAANGFRKVRGSKGSSDLKQQGPDNVKCELLRVVGEPMIKTERNQRP